MNGIEALKALEEGKIVKTKFERQYRMVEDEVQYYDEGEWNYTEIELNVWINRDYEILSEPLYNLTFLEAMAAVKEGKRVKSEFMDLIYYLDCTGKLVFENDRGVKDCGSFVAEEVMANWKIVEEKKGMDPEKFIEIVENLKEGERIHFVGEKGIEVSIVNLTCAFKMEIGSAYLVKFAKMKAGDRYVDLLDENGGLVCGIDFKYLEFEEEEE